jgi:oligopeptide transport system permease protein
MLKFIARRIVSALLTMLVIITITFFLMHLVPGGPFNSAKISEVARSNLEIKYGLDKPLIVQFGKYLQNLLRLDLGPSLILKGRSVNSIIAEKFLISAQLGLITVIFSVTVGILTGIVAAVRHNKLIDKLLMFFVTLGISMPGFVAGTLLLVLFGVYLQLFPVVWANQPANYVLPVLTYSLYPICHVAKLTRASMLDVLQQEYIRTARAKGLSNIRIYFRHALKNAMLPVISYVGPMTAFIIAGGLAVENIFSIPGLGRFFIDSISTRDYPLIMGTTIFLSTLLLGMSLIADIIYSLLDPRISLR